MPSPIASSPRLFSIDLGSGCVCRRPWRRAVVRRLSYCAAARSVMPYWSCVVLSPVASCRAHCQYVNVTARIVTARIATTRHDGRRYDGTTVRRTVRRYDGTTVRRDGTTGWAKARRHAHLASLEYHTNHPNLTYFVLKCLGIKHK